MTMRHLRWAVMALAAWLSGAGQSIQAQEAGRQWEFSLAPYLWMSGLDGDIGASQNLPPLSVDASFTDILDVLNAAFMVAGEARKGLFSPQAAIQYYDLETEAQTPGPLFSNIDVRTKLWIASAGLSYRLAEGETGFFDVIASMRYWSLDSSLNLRGGILPAQSASGSESWYDPLFGVRGRSKLGQRWYFDGYALVALGGDSDSAWDLYGGVAYDFNARWQGVIGYRHMAVDFDKGAFLYDVSQSGPIVGFSYTF